MEKYQNFTNLFQLNKTLRFELKPIGKTCELLKEGSILEKDKIRAVKFKDAKKRIDKEHKDFIETTLSSFSIPDALLTQYLDYSNEIKELAKDKKSNDNKKKKNAFKTKLTSVQKKMRKEISQAFKGKNEKTPKSKYKRLFEKNLIVQDLVEDENIKEFKDFTTYFSGFNTNRKNMYTDKKKSTAIAYRLVHDNLPIFIGNISVFEKLKKKFDEKTLNRIFEEYKSNEKSLKAKSWSEIFSLKYFNNTLTQEQIEQYNALIGKIVVKGGSEIKGLNEHINLYNQNQKDKKNRLPLFTTLKKQILSERQSLSWLPDLFESDEDVIAAIKKFYINERFEEKVLEPLRVLLKSLYTHDTHDLGGIFIKNDSTLSSFSHNVYRGFTIPLKSLEKNANVPRYESYELIAQTLRAKIEKETPKGRKAVENYQKAIDKKIKAIESLSIQEINELAKNYALEAGCELAPRKVENYFSLMRKGDFGDNDLIDNIKSKLEAATKLLNTKPSDDNKNALKDKENSQLIKELLDATKQLQHFIKPLLGTGEEADRDLGFYGEFSPLYEKFEELTLLYNKVRNWLTRKPYSQDKIKINFEKPTLLKGWDVNKEETNLCVILRKSGLYYLAIMGPKHNHCFKSKQLPHLGECYEKIDYKYTTDATKMLPKIFISSKKGKMTYCPSKEIIAIYESETYKPGNKFKIKDCRKLIDYYKDCIKKYKDWNVFDFHFSDTNSYTSMKEFCAEVNAQGYKITFRDISESYINQLVEQKKIYLFQIYNKDFSPNSKGTPNMHTLYWKMLFDDANLDNIIYKLDGEAEIFLRKASLFPKKPTHPANVPIPNKNRKNIGKQSIFKYEIIKNKRYTVNKFLFHVPITINFNNFPQNINSCTNEYIRKTDDMHVIGIDRGERNLLYYSVIDMKGNIIEQDTLNVIRNHDLETDYHELLDRREKERKESKQNWEAVENIKDLKKGYLSQAVHQIAQLVLKYNAIIVLEDLGQMFVTRGQKIEKAVYQQFEKSLVDKLIYLVDKKRAYNEPGGVLKAYQLASSLETTNKQNGFLFYVPAWNTSKIDPVTGFIDLLHPKTMAINEAQKFFGTFKDIRYNSGKRYFEFEFDYKDFPTKAKGKQTHWTICTFGTRIKRKKDNGYWGYEEVVLTEEFKKLFKDSNIDYENCNLKEEIQNKDNRKFFDDLIKLLQLTLQMRNSDDKGNDYIISPVANTEGQFFDSRNGDKKLPLDADANGAYNIARKGLWNIRQIKQTKNDKKLNLSISSTEWLDFVREKPYLK